MSDPVDALLLDVRANTQGFAADVQAMALLALPNVVGTKQVHNVFEAMESCAQEILVSPALEPVVAKASLRHSPFWV